MPRKAFRCVVVIDGAVEGEIISVWKRELGDQNSCPVLSLIATRIVADVDRLLNPPVDHEEPLNGDFGRRGVAQHIRGKKLFGRLDSPGTITSPIAKKGVRESKRREGEKGVRRAGADHFEASCRGRTQGRSRAGSNQNHVEENSAVGKAGGGFELERRAITLSPGSSKVAKMR